MNQLLPLLWFILCGLCFAMGIKTTPLCTEKRIQYLVCFSAEGGINGNMTASISMPLTSERVIQLRKYIEELDDGKFKKVVITSLTELAP